MLCEVYRGRMAQTFAINITNFTYVLWKIFQLFIDEETRIKVKLFKESYPEEIKKKIHPSQYLKVNGGLLESPTSCWPPHITSQQFTYDNSYIATEEEYHAMLQSNPYLVPSPELAEQFKSTRKPDAIPEKTYYFCDHIEKRDIYNQIVQTSQHPSSLWAKFPQYKPLDKPVEVLKKAEPKQSQPIELEKKQPTEEQKNIPKKEEKPKSELPVLSQSAVQDFNEDCEADCDEGDVSDVKSKQMMSFSSKIFFH